MGTDGASSGELLKCHPGASGNQILPANGKRIRSVPENVKFIDRELKENCKLANHISLMRFCSQGAKKFDLFYEI